MPRAALVQLRLAKEDFAFAAAHFTLFPDAAAERLHGHNYRVRVELSGAALDALGFLVPVAPVKARVRAICATLDERILIPEKSRLLELRHGGRRRAGLARRRARIASRRARSACCRCPT